MSAAPLANRKERKLTINKSMEEALAAYRASPDIMYAEPNYLLQVDALPNDPRFDELWGLNNTGHSGGTFDADIDAPEAWNLTTGSAACTPNAIGSLRSSTRGNRPAALTA